MTNNKQILERLEKTEDLSILVVDDNPMNLKMVASILKPLGYRLAMANSGEKAIQFATEKKPDLILMDVMMPEMDGYEACEKIKANPSTSDIPIIFLTAKNDITDLVKGFQSGGADFVSKPFKAEEILARIKNLLLVKISQDIIAEQNEILKQSQKSIYQDALKIVELNNSLAESEANLQELNRTKDKFFSIIGHDLKSQFSGVLGLAELLTRFGSNISDNDRETYLCHIFDGLTQMRTFLENLLEWARTQTGRIQFCPETVTLAPIFKNIELQYKNNAIKKQINLDINVHPELTINADENMLMTILRNFVSNAIKYTKVNGNVIISAKSVESGVEICVSDDGVGMDEKTKNKLFQIEHNQSLPGTDNEKGTGLGLILCKDFALKHGGNIRIESELNKGSKFILFLPA